MSNVVGIVLGPLSLNWAGLTVGKESHSVYSWGHHTLNLSPDIKKHHETQILQAVSTNLNIQSTSNRKKKKFNNN